MQISPSREHELEFSCAPLASGTSALSALLTLAQTSLSEIPARLGVPARFAATGRMRGTGPGVSFSRSIEALERDHPIELKFPFEGSAHVGGAAWLASDLIAKGDPSALAKLHWKAGADDLPMHTHTRSDRFIVVLKGRGFFHISGQPIGTFDGSDVRTIAAREGDVFLFTRDVVHTFSTAEHSMTLLSCHLPYIPLDDQEQYALPETRWIARDHLGRTALRITATGWSPLVA